MLSLCQIHEHIRRTILSRDKLSVDQTVDPQLDRFHLGFEMLCNRFDRFRDELLVFHRLLSLHNPHNGRVKRRIPILINHLYSLLRFLHLGGLLE